MISLIKTTVVLAMLSVCAEQVFATLQTSQPQVKVAIHRAESNPGKGLIEVADPRTNEKVYIHPEALITNKDIIEASAAEAPVMGYKGVREHQVKLTFTKEAADRMAEFTALHIGERLAILIDGKVASVATIAQEIHDKAQITGEINKEEAERIAKALNSQAQDTSALHPPKGSDSPSVRNSEKDEVIPPDERKHDAVEVVKRNQTELPKVTDEGFQNSVLKSRELVLVLFWTKDCRPCQLLIPTIEVIADKYKGKMKVFQLDVNEDNETARQYGIKGIPTTVLFRAGSEIDRVVGNTSQEILLRMIDRTKQ